MNIEHSITGYADGETGARVRAVAGVSSLLFVFLVCVACTTSGDRGLRESSPDMSDPDVAESSIREFLRESSIRWNEVEAAWPGQTNLATDGSSDRLRDMLGSEYAKFTGNAMLLYLRGDWSTDLEHSMHTLRAIVLNGESYAGCGAGKDIFVPGTGGYATRVWPVPHSVERAFLYRSKTYWDEMNTRVNSRHIHEEMTAADVLALQDLNQRFHSFYEEVWRMFLDGMRVETGLDLPFAKMAELTAKAKIIDSKY